MKKNSTYRYWRAVPRRSRRPLTSREVRALLSVADRDPLMLDFKHGAALIEELE